MTDQRGDVKRSPKHQIIDEQTPTEFCNKLDEAVKRGAEFLPETFQRYSIPRGRQTNYVCMIRIPADAIGGDS